MPPVRIYVDGQPLNNLTPTTIKNLPSGEHVIKVSKDDYAGSKVVIINPNEIRDETIEMSKARGGLKVYSDPPEADIYIGDQYKGRTPKIIQDITAGDYLVLLRTTKRSLHVKCDAFSIVGSS